jgi:hypothetical protein
MFFAAACMNEAHIRNSAFGKVSMSPRQYTHHIGQTKTCALPEKPAERVVCQISQTNIRLTRRFSRSALPARNRHRGDPQLASEVRLAWLSLRFCRTLSILADHSGGAISAFRGPLKGELSRLP